MLINRTPEVVQLAFDFQKYLIQVPGSPWLWPASAELAGELATQGEAPLPDAFTGDGNSSFGEDQLNVSEAQAEEVIEPDGMADDLGRKAVAGVGGGLSGHRAILAHAHYSGRISAT
jgi:hypothetical protein